MRKPKYSVAGRDRNRLAKAEAERQAGIPDDVLEDRRDPFDLPLKAVGFHDLRIEPRRGYVAWRAVNTETGKVLHCAALKQLLHWVADQLPRMLAFRNFQ